MRIYLESPLCTLVLPVRTDRQREARPNRIGTRVAEKRQLVSPFNKLPARGSNNVVPVAPRRRRRRRGPLSLSAAAQEDATQPKPRTRRTKKKLRAAHAARCHTAGLSATAALAVTTGVPCSDSESESGSRFERTHPTAPPQADSESHTVLNRSAPRPCRKSAPLSEGGRVICVTIRQSYNRGCTIA